MRAAGLREFNDKLDSLTRILRGVDPDLVEANQSCSLISNRSRGIFRSDTTVTEASDEYDHHLTDNILEDFFAKIQI